MVDNADEELVSAALSGDVESFVTLCHRYYPTLVAIAHSVLGDSHLSEDAAQEALAKACRKLDGLKSPRRFGAWLAAICRNEARNILRRNPRTQNLGDRDVPKDAAEPDHDVEAVRQALKILPVESRELLYLRYKNALSYQAISDLLGISPQAVHGRLRRARQTVREHLERQRDRRLS